jgi:GDSL-like Lipase/Acylhydrolase family
MHAIRYGRRAASTRRVRPRTHLSFMLVLLVGALTAILPSVASANGPSYVAMGDSYTAGPGILPYSTTAPPGCGQSQANYPHLVASVLGLSLTDVSCGGAKTENFENEQVLAFPPNNPPQFNALSASTNVVSLGMGGNDFNAFGTLVEGCSQIDSAWLAAHGNEGAPCKAALEGFVQNALKEDVAPSDAALAKIRALSPNAKVFVVGYPEITPANGFCPTAIPWTTGDLTWFREIEQQGNALKRSEALANHDVFVDTFPLSIGHNACEPVGKRWIEPIIGSLTGVALHPNATGQQADAVDVGLAMVLNGVF